MGNFDEEKYGGMERYANYFEGCRPKLWQTIHFVKDYLSALNVFSIFVNLFKYAFVAQSPKQYRDFAGRCIKISACTRSSIR